MPLNEPLPPMPMPDTDTKLGPVKRRAPASGVRNLMSFHLIPIHMRNSDFDAIARLKPPVIKTVDASPDVLNRLYASSPNSLFFVRDWALSEQHSDMFAQPEATGQRHAREMYDKIVRLSIPRNQIVVPGINEPHVWTNVDAVVRYYAAFCDACTALGIKAAALNLSVGWPANKGANTPPDWTPYEPVHAAIRRGGHYLCCHEYTDDKQGIGGMWGWWTGRTLTCPWNVPILIGEWGVDLYVSNPNVDKMARGWRPYMNAEAFWDLCVQYNARLSADPRVMGICGFTSDGAREWQSFDFEPVYTHWFRWAEQPFVPAPPPQPQPPPLPPTPVPVPVPEPQPTGVLVHPCAGFPITQRFYQNPQNYARFGLPGHNGTDFGVPLNTPLKAPADGTVEWTGLDEKGYGNYVRIYSPNWGCHFFLAHMQQVMVQRGQTVKAGQVIGLCGSTGNSTGPHLHLEVRLGTRDAYSSVTPMTNGRVDPETWFAQRGLKL